MSTCCICFEPVKPDDVDGFMSACDHTGIMHYRCLREWSNACGGRPLCPLCRTSGQAYPNRPGYKAAAALSNVIQGVLPEWLIIGILFSMVV